MTFLELISDVQNQLNHTSPDSAVRIGRAINRRYKSVTSSIGMQTSRRASVNIAATIGNAQLVVPSFEKISLVKDLTNKRRLTEVPQDEILGQRDSTTTGTPRKFAVLNHTADTVTLIFDLVPDEAVTFYISGHQAIGPLSGDDTPAFSESFHDILIWGALADEYRKLMHPDLAQDAEAQFTNRLSDLRMWIAKSAYLDIYSAKNSRLYNTTTAPFIDFSQDDTY